MVAYIVFAPDFSQKAQLGTIVTWTFTTLDPAKAQDGVGFMVPIAVAVIGLFGALYFSSKYENSRWETYF